MWNTRKRGYTELCAAGGAGIISRVQPSHYVAVINSEHAILYIMSLDVLNITRYLKISKKYGISIT